MIVCLSRKDSDSWSLAVFWHECIGYQNRPSLCTCLFLRRRIIQVFGDPGRRYQVRGRGAGLGRRWPAASIFVLSRIKR